MAEGKEGDWECSGCRNRNYAFRCFCNRCKQPRLLVDTMSPADAKWLPRVGDWICTSNTLFTSLSLSPLGFGACAPFGGGILGVNFGHGLRTL
ncbi:hypothetical protein BHE74_00029201 [Ensete ventricosum]|nr:hypothetical protein GW17_00019618 [Ensete ventricosum]RWW63607.1 hypothetical protein BHE74_00029201 [Ensete ventricosum]RZS08190.1 hypothetical protein BHM03_00039127 [Ensete ventricosum]